MELLGREPYSNLDSIIIYCSRQQTTETVAQILRTSIQSWSQNENCLTPEQELMGTGMESGTKCQMPNQKLDVAGMESGSKKRRKSLVTKSAGRKRKKVAAILADSYHAGMSASRRKSVQNSFMRGDLRIVVATVAFGMGLDKADVRAIVHYNMPMSVESFVQEIGRAGRDGLPAYCHTFIDREVRGCLGRYCQHLLIWHNLYSQAFLVWDIVLIPLFVAVVWKWKTNTPCLNDLLVGLSIVARQRSPILIELSV